MGRRGTKVAGSDPHQAEVQGSALASLFVLAGNMVTQSRRPTPPPPRGLSPRPPVGGGCGPPGAGGAHEESGAGRGARPVPPSHGARAGRVGRGGRPEPLGAPRCFSPLRPGGPREAG